MHADEAKNTRPAELEVAPQIEDPSVSVGGAPAEASSEAQPVAALDVSHLCIAAASATLAAAAVAPTHADSAVQDALETAVSAAESAPVAECHGNAAGVLARSAEDGGETAAGASNVAAVATIEIEEGAGRSSLVAAVDAADGHAPLGPPFMHAGAAPDENTDCIEANTAPATDLAPEENAAEHNGGAVPASASVSSDGLTSYADAVLFDRTEAAPVESQTPDAAAACQQWLNEPTREDCCTGALHPEASPEGPLLRLQHRTSGALEVAVEASAKAVAHAAASFAAATTAAMSFETAAADTAELWPKAAAEGVETAAVEQVGLESDIQPQQQSLESGSQQSAPQQLPAGEHQEGLLAQEQREPPHQLSVSENFLETTQKAAEQKQKKDYSRLWKIFGRQTDAGRLLFQLYGRGSQTRGAPCASRVAHALHSSTKTRVSPSVPLLLVQPQGEAAAAEHPAKGTASYRQRLVNIPTVGRRPSAVAAAKKKAERKGSCALAGAQGPSLPRRPLRKTLQQIVADTQRNGGSYQPMLLQRSDSWDREMQKDALARSFRMEACLTLPPKARLPSLTEGQRRELLSATHAA
ncbi:hypothetical protein cyc_01294 [Cyclospora cayetanensis]|uniref:Uncharacterized protein n=1 Tax=Cyclospora cayetanensis TaxID=88456 RepID=A0A1D3D0R9_9EIME|nr:hypothetical protein cyc_01294 [Cyclospora cayetanensis]